jgi:hypothetical protein
MRAARAKFTVVRCEVGAQRFGCRESTKLAFGGQPAQSFARTNAIDARTHKGPLCLNNSNRGDCLQTTSIYSQSPGVQNSEKYAANDNHAN